MLPIKLTPEKLITKWGWEYIIHRNEDYCAKILHYNFKGDFSSFHGHCGFYNDDKKFVLGKKETWYVLRGSFSLSYLLDSGERTVSILNCGDAIFLDRGVFHQLKSLEDNSEIFEASTKDDCRDIVRIEPGMNQLAI